MPPVLPALLLVAHTNIFFVTATAFDGTSYQAPHAIAIKQPGGVQWDFSQGVSNYTVWMTNWNGNVRNFNIGTNLLFVWPPLTTNSFETIYTFTGTYSVTNPTDGPRFFSLCESTDLKTWKPTPTAQITYATRNERK